MRPFLTVATLAVIFLTCGINTEYISNLEVDLKNPTYEDILRRGKTEQEWSRFRQKRQV